MTKFTLGKRAYKIVALLTVFISVLCQPKTSLAQVNSKIVPGVVVDEDQKPLSGVTIINLRTSSGVNSDSKGNFSIQKVTFLLVLKKVISWKPLMWV